MKELKDYLHYYIGCEAIAEGRPARIESVSYHPVIDMVTVRFTDTDKDDDWTVYNDLTDAKPLLRTLESMTDEEAQECLVEVFDATPHNAYMDMEALKQYLCNNTEYALGVAIEDEDSMPMSCFCVTPQTYFNLTLWLLKRGFDLFGLIPSGLAIDATLTTDKAEQ